MKRRSPRALRLRPQALQTVAFATLLEFATAAEGASRQETMRHATAAEHCAMVEAAIADKTKRSPTPEPVRLEAWQRREIERLIRLDDEGRLTHGLWVVSWPRRYGKTMFVAQYLVLRCLTRPNQVCWIVANSEEQAQAVVFARCVEALRWSPALRDRIDRPGGWQGWFDPAKQLPVNGNPFGEIDPVGVVALAAEIRFGNGSIIRVVSSEAASAFGGRLSVAVASELHAARQQDAWDSISGCVGDAWCGLAIIDSTQGDKDNIVGRTTNAALLAERTNGADGDPHAAASWISHHDLHCACRDAPSWIDAGWLRSRAGSMPPSSFARQHLNQQVGSGSPCFPPALLRRAAEHEASGLLCRGDAPSWDGCYTGKQDFDTLRRMFRGHSLRVEIGLDRSMGLSRGDRSAVVITASGVSKALRGRKVMTYDADGNETGLAPQSASTWCVIGVAFLPHGDGGIFGRIVRRVERLYGESPVITLETNQCKDLHDWAVREGYSAVIQPLTDAAKARHVLRLTEWLHTGRLALPARRDGHCGALHAEMARYAETDAGGRCPQYGGERTTVMIPWRDGRASPVSPREPAERPVRIKDDIVEALMWASHQTALAEAEADAPVAFFGSPA